MFGNIDRRIRQVFLWGIKTLTFPPRVCKAEPSPHTPLSPFPGGEWGRGVRGGGGWGREPTPNCRVIYSYIQFTQKSTALPSFGKWRILKFYTQKSAALWCGGKGQSRVWAAMPCSRKWSIFKHLYSEKSAALACSRK